LSAFFAVHFPLTPAAHLWQKRIVHAARKDKTDESKDGYGQKEHDVQRNADGFCGHIVDTAIFT